MTLIEVYGKTHQVPRGDIGHESAGGHLAQTEIAKSQIAGLPDRKIWSYSVPNKLTVRLNR